MSTKIVIKLKESCQTRNEPLKIKVKLKPPDTKKKKRKKKNNHESLSPFSSQPKSNFVTVKTSLKSILKNYDHNSPLIHQLVTECHEIAVRTYQFMRLYILYKYGKIDPSKEELIPPLKSDYIMSFIRAIGIHDPRGKKPKDTVFGKELDDFYHREFEPCINKEKVNLFRKTDLLSYLATQIQTSYENNIKEHFIERIRTIMNCLKPNSLTDKTLFARIKNWILLDQQELIPDSYQEWSRMIKKEYLPTQYEKC